MRYDFYSYFDSYRSRPRTKEMLARLEKHMKEDKEILKRLEELGD